MWIIEDEFEESINGRNRKIYSVKCSKCSTIRTFHKHNFKEDNRCKTCAPVVGKVYDSEYQAAYRARKKLDKPIAEKKMSELTGFSVGHFSDEMMVIRPYTDTEAQMLREYYRYIHVMAPKLGCSEKLLDEVIKDGSLELQEIDLRKRLRANQGKQLDHKKR